MSPCPHSGLAELGVRGKGLAVSMVLQGPECIWKRKTPAQALPLSYQGGLKT
jgi:hypothetical protein